ncbi:winged helix-turn-helix domain-containing protein [Methylorubrum thiocyanatum]|uniref:winged helix-turn-helix domain-containing protein n=1 Tax=Methylorubrum thiocyanatum TaxID=47958 RepID=UPI0035C876B7
MDAYLKIAQEVLQTERRPLSPRAILASAYRSGMVSPHLFGKTQHKTLGARLSEDLVLRHERSPFFRTAPGRFFLREFLTDKSLPEEYRRPVPTRRRFRELVRGPALAIDVADLGTIAELDKPIPPSVILGLLHADRCRYEDPRQKNPHSVFFRSYVCVHRNEKVLSYRLGRYREDRDSFMSKRSIGFVTFVHDEDHTLFNQEDFGIVDSGVRATRVDLDVPELPNGSPGNRITAHLSHFIWTNHTSHAPTGGDLLAVVCFECPDWFEPVKRRLALNDLRWLESPKSINNLDDFDPWSKTVILNNHCDTSVESEEVARPQAHRQNQRRLPEGANRDR